jgi:hypothetical protein
VVRGLQHQGITLRDGGGRLTIDPRRARGRAGAAIEPMDRQPDSMFYTLGSTCTYVSQHLESEL